MKISEFINKDLVNVGLKSRTKDGVLAEIVDQLYRHRRVNDKKQVLESLLKREGLGSTGMERGVAIPHARISGLKEPIIFAGLSKQGINFSSLDGKAAHLIILFLTPLVESGTHLKILSKIAAMLNDKLFVNQLAGASTNDELYHMLKHIDVNKEGFHTLTKEEIYLELRSGDDGISEISAGKRLEAYGPNKLKAIRKHSLIMKFISNFTNVLAILMWVGSALAFWAKMPEVGWAIIVVIFINAVFSFWQEFKAEKAIDALKKLIPFNTRVLRDGKEKKVPSSDLVPGDIIIIEEGDNVPADARLVESQELRVNNSAFSGESALSYKMSEGFHNGKSFLWLEIPNLIFAGTNVATGFGKAIVIATGMSTEIGKIAYLTQTVKEDLSPLQKEISRLTKLIAVLSIVMGFVFFFIGLSFTKMSSVASAMFAIGIIMGNVPEGLMPTVTLALSMAVQRMAKKNALIKKLSSVETLGCTNVICTDKTGTLTTNQMSIRKIWINDKVIEVTGSGYEPKGAFMFQEKAIAADAVKDDNMDLLMRAAILCNTAKLVAPSREQGYWNIIGDPTEGALLTAAKKMGFEDSHERQRFPLYKRFPFESIRKRMSSINKLPGGGMSVFVKGAPKELLDISTKIILGKNIVGLTDVKK